VSGYCVFETAIGTCGIAWNDAPAVKYFQFPEGAAPATEARIARRCGGAKTDAPPAVIAALIEKVTMHLRGELQDFSDAPVDLSALGEFDRAVMQAALKIPAGETRTYGDLAKAVGRPAEARAVGQVMARNPIPLIVPCHRVVAANGGLGGFSAPGALQTKTRLLAIERAKFPAVFEFPE
jgi:methylated-DNA-[protein]-cysteine S-methyltransferase